MIKEQVKKELKNFFKSMDFISENFLIIFEFDKNYRFLGLTILR